MNFLENNSTKIAGILCTATMLPVVGTVMAMETAPGWRDDSKYVTEDGVYAKGWTEINGDAYYFDEEGTLDAEKTASVYTAKATTAASETLKETLRTAISEMTEEEAQAEEADTAAAEEQPETAKTPVQAEAPAISEVTEPETPVIPEVSEPVQQPEAAPIVPEAPAETPAEPAPEQPEVPSAPEYTEPAQPEVTEPETPVIPEVSEPVQQPEAAPIVPEAPVETPAAPAPEQPEVPSVPEYTEPVQPEVPSEPDYVEPVQPEAPAGGQYDELNQNIVNAALGLVGVTNGWQCTEVATAALNGAGVSAGVVWPDQYLQYGYVTGEPQPGNLIYYDQGGRGLDHIAIYIGDGQAVHGNYDGQTVIASAYLPAASSMTFIQVTF